MEGNPMFTKQKVAALVAEFLGTAILALTVLAISTSNIGIGYFVSFGAGLTLLLMVFAIGNISGAVINPAIAIGLWTVRKLSTLQTITYIAVQLLGGVAAYALFSYLTDKTWANQGEYDTRLLVAETVGTAVFAFGIAAAIFQKLEGVTKAITIGGSLTLGIMIASAASSAFLNPAVALGAHSWVWGTYVLGPVIGAVIGFNLYNLLFAASNTARVVAKAEQPTSVAETTAKPATRKKTTAKKKK
jgi:aquaporin Z